MSKFKKINFAEYINEKCKVQAWELLKDIDFNVKPMEPRLLNEGLIKLNLQLHIIGRKNKPDYTYNLDGDNCFLFSLDGELLNGPNKKKILSKIEEVKKEYGEAFLK